MLTACKGTKWIDVPTSIPPGGSVTGKPGETEKPDGPDPTDETFISCSYIRGDFLETNRIPGVSIGVCSDLIYLTAHPYVGGDLTFDLPVNDAILTGAAAYATSYNRRNGVLELDGTGKMNAGDDLLHSPDGAFRKFAFGTYVYVSEWAGGVCLFRKVDGGSAVIAFRLGATEGDLKLTVGGAMAVVMNSALRSGAQHYVAVIYDDGAARLYVDTNNTATDFTGSLPVSVPNTRAGFMMGEGLKDYLDETFVNSLLMGTLERNPISFDNWNSTKTLAYWKYSDVARPGKDSHTWATRLEQIRTALNGQAGDRKIRSGIAGGEWLRMIDNATAHTNFANNIKKVIEQYNLGGADLGFEWAYSGTDLSNYSKAIVQLREVLGKDVFLTISLHPVSYRIDTETIVAVDFIPLQCYGPSVGLFSIECLKSNGKAAVDYRIPQGKLVMGISSYGATGTAGEQVAYFDLVGKSNLTNTSADTWSYKGKNYMLNSQNTIRQKTQCMRENGFGGVMSWDLATNVGATYEMSLLGAVKGGLNYYADPAVE